MRNFKTIVFLLLIFVSLGLSAQVADTATTFNMQSHPPNADYVNIKVIGELEFAIWVSNREEMKYKAVEYQVEVQDESRTPVAIDQFRVPDGSEVISIKVPREKLSPGKYTIKILAKNYWGVLENFGIK